MILSVLLNLKLEALHHLLKISNLLIIFLHLSWSTLPLIYIKFHVSIICCLWQYGCLYSVESSERDTVPLNLTSYWAPVKFHSKLETTLYITSSSKHVYWYSDEIQYFWLFLSCYVFHKIWRRTFCLNPQSPMANIDY